MLVEMQNAIQMDLTLIAHHIKLLKIVQQISAF